MIWSSLAFSWPFQIGTNQGMLEEQAARQQQAHGRRSVFRMFNDLIGYHLFVTMIPNHQRFEGTVALPRDAY